MEIVGTLVLMAPVAILLLVLHLRARAAAEDTAPAEPAADPGAPDAG